MSQTNDIQFSKWRSLLWPIHAYELKKLIPMVMLFFLILFNYTVLRDTKDTLIVTASGSGAEAIPFLKVWAVLPMAVIFMLVYAKLSNKLSKPALFYTAIIPFLVFYILFALVLYPCREFLHPTTLADKLEASLPGGFMGLIAVFRNWTFSLFYVMAELWGSVAISLLFWGFANDTTKITESKRFYSLFGAFANLALIVSGPVIILSSNIRQKVPLGIDPWQISLYLLMGTVVLSGILILGIYWWINRNVLTDPRFYSQDEQKIQKKAKPKMSLKESFLFLIRSKYMGCIAILVIAYGISINIVEVTWKGQLKLQYPNPNDYSTFMGKFSLTTGIITTFMTLFVGGNMMRRFGWKKTALITPIALLLTGTVFFSFVIFRDNLGAFIGYIGTTPLFIAVIIGMAQNVFSKSSKYAFFDPTKETAYIPLDQESKVKGKAAVDVVGARLGKAGGALMQQGLIIALGSIAAMTPYVAMILFAIIGIWIVAAYSLNKQFLRASAKQQTEALAIASAAKEMESAALSEDATTLLKTAINEKSLTN